MCTFCDYVNRKAFKSVFVARKHMIKRKQTDNEEDPASSEGCPRKKQKCKDSGDKGEDKNGLSDSQVTSSPVKDAQNEKLSNDMEVDSSETGEGSLSKNGVIVNQDSAVKEEPITSKKESENTMVHGDSSLNIKHKVKVEELEDSKLKESGGKFILINCSLIVIEYTLK